MDAERAPPGAWRFAGFTLDLARGALLADDGTEVPLRPKSFALLRFLVENAGRLVDRDAIMAAVWPDVVVTDELITQCIRDIRKTLGDEAQQVLKTVPRRGYLFAAEVTPAATTAKGPRAERRLAAILAADIVGYSRLIEQDEAGTLAAIKALREEAIDPLLADHKGRIVKLMGDGAIVEFASVVDAVACAVAIQKLVAELQAKLAADRRIVFRIAINLGDVVVDGDDLLGDGVNVAARLEQLCEPGGVLVSGTAFDHLQGRLGLPLEFTGEQQVKNIARPIRAYRVRLDEHSGRLEPPPAREHGAQRLALAAAGALCALVFSGGVWWFWPADPPSPKPSVAVLPFDNLGGDEATGRLADGLTEDVITDLARFRDLDVIARNSTAAYKSKPVDVRQVRKDLAVGYVLEGSIQRSGDRVRVTAQLIDARAGSHVWANRWDRPTSDVFAVQAEVAEQVANLLASGGGVLNQQALAAVKRKKATDLGAYDLVQLGWEAHGEGSQAGFERALSQADAAIARDPSYAAAYVLKGWSAFQLAQTRGDAGSPFAEMETIARKAISLAPDSAFAYSMLGFAAIANGDAKAAHLRAIELAPSSADVLNLAADRMPFVGEPELAAELCDRSFRLNPLAPAWYNADCIAPYFFVRRFHDSIKAAERTRSGFFLNKYGLVFLAASQGELGQAEHAKVTIEELKRRFPDASLEQFLQSDWIFERKEEEDQILASARKAGVRICATDEELKPFASSRRLPECDAEGAKAAATRS